MGALYSSLASTERPSYDLPPELLDLVIAGLTDPADRARARAVCHSWHAAVRRHGPQPWRLPRTLSFWRRLLSLPRGSDIVGSTNDWLAIRVGEERGKFLLHNPFIKKTVPLPELSVIGRDKSKIYRFLMRSGVDDLIVVITNSRRHGFMMIRPGKGVWLPPPRTHPYIHIIDSAFLGGKLYAITTAEDLIPFDVTLDGEGKPVVTMGRRLIKQPPDYHGHDAHEEVKDAPNGEDDEDDDDDAEEHVVDAPNEEEDEKAQNPNDMTSFNCPLQFWPRIGRGDDINITTRHLIESRGKLLMVRHHQQMCPPTGVLYLTLGVEVFEADTGAGVWIQVTGGLGGGRALFISLNFSKSVAAPCGEVEEDVIYFMDTGEVFDLKSGTSRPSRLCRSFGQETWLFHPELVL